MVHLDSAAGRTAFAGGKEYLFFSGYSYLGMSHVPKFIELVKEGIDRYGLLHPSARISNTQLKLYEVFEEQLSSLTGTENTVTFSSGYLAGRAVVELFMVDKKVFILPNTHPVLRTGQKIYNGSIEDLIEEINNCNQEEIVIISDSVNALAATINDFSFLASINKRVTCIIDDSHGIGLIGENGKGIYSLLPQLSNVDFILTYSLSKGLHINGGAVSCNTETATRLRSSPYFTASTAIAPAMVYAFINASEVYAAQQKKLQQNITTFIELIKDIPLISYHPSLPVFILPSHWDEEVFNRFNMIISSFSYPDPTGVKINRIVLSALHTVKDLGRVAEVLHRL